MFSVTAAYRDGRVYLNKKNYPAGIIATNFLNIFYKNDIAARISVFSDEINHNIICQLRCGYLNIRNFVDTGNMILQELRVLQKLPVYSNLDYKAITRIIAELFSNETGQQICNYFVKRAEISLLSQDEVIVDTAYRKCDIEYIDNCEKLISEIVETLTFFNTLTNDMHVAHKNLTTFVDSLPDIEKHDEGHLLPVAKDIFGNSIFNLDEEFIEVKKNAKSQFTTIARQLHFNNFYSLIVTDFFEGLHYGHYPKRCEICGQYFLMQSARRQKYCTHGIAPEKYKNKPITCRSYAAIIHRKELSKDNPVMNLYNKRCSAIRSEAHRGTITTEFAEKAKQVAKRRLTTAKRDPEYAKIQYAKDLSREKLYADVAKELK